MAVLLEPKRRERERRPRDRGPPGPQPELPGQQVGAEERQRVGEQEHEVVAEHRRVRPGPEEPRRAHSPTSASENASVSWKGQNWFESKKWSG